MILISDIDGTLGFSIFNDANAKLQETPEFQAALAAVPLLPWVVEHGLAAFKMARVVIFVTGRGPHLNNVTSAWIVKNLGIWTFNIVNVGFTSYEQYVLDKELRLAEAIRVAASSRPFPYEMIHVMEDDPRLLDWLEVQVATVPAMAVHAVDKLGNHSIRATSPPIMATDEVPRAVPCSKFMCGSILVYESKLAWCPASSDGRGGRREVATVRCERCGSVKYVYRYLLGGTR